MQRRLNVRLLFWTVGILVILGLGVSYLHAYQVRRNAHILLERGDRALNDKDLTGAVVFWSQYLALAPGDLAAQEKVALTLDKLALGPADKIRVVLRLEELLMADPSRHEARERLVHNLIALGRFPDAIIHLRQLLSVHPDAKGHALLGQCQAAAGDFPAAAATLRRAIELQPDRLANYLLLADLLQRRLDQEDEAVKTIDQMINANPKNAEAYLARSRFAQQRGLIPEAADDLRRAVELAPDEPGVVLAAARWDEQHDRVAEARKHLRRGVELHPEQGSLVLALANLEIRGGKRDNAIRVLETGIRKAPGAFELQIMLADLLIDAGRHDEAARLVDSMTRAGLVPVFPNYLQARLAVARGQWQDAIVRLEKARTDFAAQPEWASRVNALLGGCYEKTGDSEQSLVAWQRAVQIEPGWTTAKYHLGRALLAQGRCEDALIELEAVSLAKDAPPESWAALARAQLLVMLQRPEPLRDWSVVETSLNKAAKQKPANVELTLLRAEMLGARRGYAEAGAMLEHAASAAPDVLYDVALADLQLRQANYAAAAEVLRKAERSFGKHIELTLAAVRLRAARGNEDDRDALRTLAEGAETLAEHERMRLWQALARAWQTLGDASLTQAMLERIALAQPKDLPSRLTLLELALQRNDSAAARKLVNELRKLEGDAGSYWRWGKIAVQVQEAHGSAVKLAGARAQLVELAQRRPDWSRVPLLQAQVEEIEGNWVRAIEAGIKAVELGERHPRFVGRLVQLLIERRQYAKAEHLLFLAEERGPLPKELARSAIDLAAVAGNAARVRELVARNFPTPSRDYRDLLWLAGIHARIDESVKAEDLLRKAVARAEHAPEAWIALVEHLARHGRHTEAAQVIDGLQTKMPKERRAFTTARCWEVIGDLDRAGAAYHDAMAEQPHDFALIAAAADAYWQVDQPKLAAPWYEKLLNAQVAAPPETAAMARRRLALCRAEAKQWSEAFALLDANRQTFGELVEDERVRWFLDGRAPSQRWQALQRLRESFERFPSTVDEELMLVQLEETVDIARARDRITHLLSTKETPQAMAHGVRLLVKTEAFDDAARWLAKLERWQPTSPRTQELRKLVPAAASN